MYSSSNLITKLEVTWEVASGKKDKLGNPTETTEISNTLSLRRIQGIKNLDSKMGLSQLEKETDAHVISDDKKLDPRIVPGSYGRATVDDVSYTIRYIRPSLPGMAIANRVLGQQIRIEIAVTTVA